MSNHSQDTRYGAYDHPLTRWMEEVHESSAMLLAHWDYFKRCDLLALDRRKADNSPLKHLKEYQREFIIDIAERMKTRCKWAISESCPSRKIFLNAERCTVPFIPTSPSQGCWEHELYWVSKMFTSKPGAKPGWSPPETFTRMKPSVGLESI